MKNKILLKIFSVLSISVLIIGMAISSWSKCVGGVYAAPDGSTRQMTQEELDWYNHMIETVGAGNATAYDLQRINGIEVGSSAPIPSGTNEGSMSAIPPVPNVPAAQPQPQTSAPAAPARTYSHDFPEINDEALEALSYFTTDGVPESAYINIADVSEKNVVPGSTLNLSLKNSEDLKVSYVKEDGSIAYEWGISNLLVEDGYELNLSATIKRDETSDFPGTSILKFNDGKTVSGNHLSFNLNVGVSENTIHVYKKSGDDYEEIYTGSTDENGMLMLYPEELTEYVLSETDIPEEQKRIEEEKRLEEERLEKEKQDAKRIEEMKEAGAKEVASTEIANPTEGDTPKATEPSSPAQETTNTDKSFPIIPVAAGAVVLLIVIIARIKKK